ncbi:transglycosylase domain-containing protein [Bacillus massiliglaciei]|uniref:transglycosylase domain-containing protein n=1 Tax=Bacillus massiliglaciei TaxID=1816693 RepID=UPI000A774737|nr:transglycosylase domain-containing protein [Bacillus massiliglaciei]
MRKVLGFLMIGTFIPILSVFIYLTLKEWSQSVSLNDQLDKKISPSTLSLPETSQILAGNGQVISEISLEQKRIMLEDQEIPAFLKDLFIISEDRKFYSHAGIDLSAVSRALIINSQSDSIEQGASTITQQLARNIYLNTEKTYNRKLSELLYAYQLERVLSKQEILSLYINTIYFQNGVYGIEAASQFYFSKKTQELTPAELAFLAAIPNNPELYNPLKRFDLTKKRQERLLLQMQQEGKLSKSEYSQLVKEKIVLQLQQKKDEYPDYVTYVHYELKKLVAQKGGLSKQLASKNSQERNLAEKQLDDKVSQLLNSGVNIHTALDIRLQTTAKQAIQSRLQHSDIEGASVVIQHHTHQLVSLIGGKDYKKNSFNRAYQSYRQPGSAIKPLLDYAPYFEKTEAPVSQLVSGGRYCTQEFCPQNYGGGVYGMVSLKKAFANSYNTPAIRLLERTGVKTSFGYLQPFQFKMVDEEDYRLTAGIGGFRYGMSPLELTDAFTSFDNGLYQPAHAIRKITDRKGKTIYEWKEEPVRVWSQDTVSKMRVLLHETMVAGTAKKAYYSSDYIGGKTGTTNDIKDIWLVGLTEDYTTGVWMGKDTPATLQSIYSSAPHMAAWKQISQAAAK